MIDIVSNKDHLNDSDMTEVVGRVKILLINSKKEILLGYSHHEYQFPGGHVEDNEQLIDTVKRELQEEVGLSLDISNIRPFARKLGYYKDWPVKGKNRKIEIYYYEIKTDERPKLENTSYTEHELDGNFELRYIPLDTIEEELKNNVLEFGDDHGIAKEMLELISIYKNQINK